MMLARDTFRKIGAFVGSLKTVAVQTWRLVPVRRKEVKSRSRAEREQVRINNAALVPVTFLGLSQFIPVLGNIPVLLALAYPRQMLSEAFYTPDQLALVRQEEYAEKVMARRAVADALCSAQGVYTSLTHFQKKGRFHLPTCREQSHLEALCRSNALFASHRLYSILPGSLLKSSLVQRAREIAQDDELLRPALALESASAAFSDTELLTACTRRGSKPTLCRDESLLYLRSWLTLRCHQTPSDGVPVDEGSRLSLLAHSLALGLPSGFAAEGDR